jgi:hypothetical protein
MHTVRDLGHNYLYGTGQLVSILTDILLAPQDHLLAGVIIDKARYRDVFPDAVDYMRDNVFHGHYLVLVGEEHHVFHESQLTLIEASRGAMQ